MRAFAAILLLAAGIASLTGCGVPTPLPTPDIEATIEVRVRETLEAEQPAATERVPSLESPPTATAAPMPRPTTTVFVVPTVTPVVARSAVPTPRPRPVTPVVLTNFPTATPYPTPTHRPPLSAEEARRLAEYADRNAGAPGAIYVGDLSMLAGVAPTPELGDSDGFVSLEALQRHQWLYESEHYRFLLEQSSLHSPTPLTSSGERIRVQHGCINEALPPCILFEAFFVPNLLERTEGQIEFIVNALPQLGYAGRDTLQHLYRSDLDSATVYPGFID